MVEKLEAGPHVDEIVVALTAYGISVASVDAGYNLVWVGANGVIAGLITGYEGCKPGTFAIIDRFGDSYGGNDHGHTLADAVTTVAAYVRDSRTYQTQMSTNVLVEDGEIEDLNWNTVDLSDGIDDVLDAEADELRGDAFRRDLDHMDWENAKVYVRIAPENDLVELARAPVFEDAEGPESYGAKRMDALEANLEAEVLLSTKAIRSEAGLDSSEDIEAIVDAVRDATRTWRRSGNCLGVNLSSCPVDVANGESDDGKSYVSVSSDRDIFREDAAELQDELEELVSEAIERFAVDQG